MAAIDFTPVTATYGTGYAGVFGNQNVQLWRQYIDVTNTTKWGVTATTWALNNTVDLILLPVGTFIIAGGIEIITPESVNTTATISWGTAAAATAWAATAASNGAAGTMSAALLNTAGTSINVATATKARLTVGTAALTNVKFAVWILMLQAGQQVEFV